MKSQPEIKPLAFSFPPNDALAREHTEVAQWVEDAASSLNENQYYQQFELKSLPSGKRLLAADPEQARRYVLAAVAQTRHWDQLAMQLRDQAETEMERINGHHLPGWAVIWGRRQQSKAVIHALLRRKLPLVEQDLLDILAWCNQAEQVSPYWHPLSSIVRLLQRFAEGRQVDDELRTAMQKFASRLRSCHDKTTARLGTSVEQICGTGEPADQAVSDTPAVLPPPQPAAAGQPDTTSIGPDGFPLANDSPLHDQHALITQLMEEVVGTRHDHQPRLGTHAAGRVLLQQEPDPAGRALLAAAERHVHALLAPSADYSEAGNWQSRASLSGSGRLQPFAGRTGFSRPDSADRCRAILERRSRRVPHETTPHDRLERAVRESTRGVREQRLFDFDRPKTSRTTRPGVHGRPRHRSRFCQADDARRRLIDRLPNLKPFRRGLVGGSRCFRRRAAGGRVRNRRLRRSAIPDSRLHATRR